MASKSRKSAARGKSADAHATTPTKEQAAMPEQAQTDVLAKISKSIVPAGYRERLVKHADVKTAGGNPTIDNNDDVATYLRGKSLADVWAIATKAMGDEVSTALHAKYDKLNPGQQRMNLGNRLRAMFRAGQWKPQ